MRHELGLLCMDVSVYAKSSNTEDSRISNEPQESVVCIIKDRGTSNGGGFNVPIKGLSFELYDLFKMI